MRQWRGKESNSDHKVGQKCKLQLLELFLVLVRLRVGLPVHDLAKRFDLSKSTVSRLTVTWVNLMYLCLKDTERFPPRHIIQKYMPKVFRVTFPNARVIIDATEFAVERPSSLVSQAGTFSSYKHMNTIKVLIGITPSGAVSFVSQTFEGSISDKQLTAQSGLLDKLEDGDDILADKGFVIQDLLAPLGVR